MTEETRIFYLDDDGNVVPKDQATHARILEYKDGERFESYGLLEADEEIPDRQDSMQFVITFDERAPDTITLRARAESEDSGIVGDMVVDVKPGEEFEGLTYELLRQHGEGKVWIPMGG